MGKIVTIAALLVLGAAGTNPTQSDGFDGTLSGALTGPNGETLTNSPDGSWTIAADNGQQEDMSWDMSSTANQIDISSSTGVTRVKYDTIGLQCVDLLVGTNANFTDFSNSVAVISKGDTGLTNANEIALMVESKADAGPTIAINTLGMTRLTHTAYGGIFRAVVDGPTNTGDAIGLLAKSQDTHTNGDNYGLRTLATGGVNNWSIHNDGGIFAQNGQIMTIDSSSTEEMQMFDSGGDWTLSNLLNNASGNEVGLTLSYTVNKAAGNSTGLVVNMTDTASPGTDLLFDFQRNTSTSFSCDTAGRIDFFEATMRGNSFNTTGSSAFQPSSSIGSAANGVFRFTSKSGTYLNGSSGILQWINLDPNVNQSGTAGYTILDIDPVITAVGSGQSLLFRAALDGAQKFTIDPDGDVTQETSKGGILKYDSKVETVTFAGGGEASKTTTTTMIPAGAMLDAVTTYVTVTDTGACTSMDIGDGTDVDLFANDSTMTQGDTTANDDFTDALANPYTSNTEITVTGVGGNCADLAVRITTWYRLATADTTL